MPFTYADRKLSTSKGFFVTYEIQNTRKVNPVFCSSIEWMAFNLGTKESKITTQTGEILNLKKTLIDNYNALSLGAGGSFEYGRMEALFMLSYNHIYKRNLERKSEISNGITEISSVSMRGDSLVNNHNFFFKVGIFKKLHVSCGIDQLKLGLTLGVYGTSIIREDYGTMRPLNLNALVCIPLN